MRYLSVIIVLFFTQLSFGQQPKQLSTQELVKTFSANVKEQLGIMYPIFRVYEQQEGEIKYYVVYTEKNIAKTKPVRSSSVQVFLVKKSNNNLNVAWQAKDFIKKSNKADAEENSIWFWTKYCSLSDLDEDGLLDLVVVYGTAATNGTDDGRVKLLIYHKKKKYAIRHQNSTLDFERQTQVDASVYSLPAPILKEIKATMQKIEAAGQAIFPSGIYRKMEAKALLIRE